MEGTVGIGSLGQPPAKPQSYPLPWFHLRSLEFGVILNIEQIDVCHVLLADLPYAPAPGARVPFQIGSILSRLLFSHFLYQELKTNDQDYTEVLQWPH
jgi:hypothetical protein